LPANIVVYPASAIFSVLIRDNMAMPGVMWTTRAGARMLVASLLILLAASVAPLGRGKILLDCWSVDRNESVGVLMLEVAPLSSTAEGIDQSRTPCLNSLLSWRYTCWSQLSVMAARWLVAHQ
jgi:hypothetical protein